MDEKKYIDMGVINSLIDVLKTPIAKRQGITMSPEMCAEWAERLNEFVKKNS